MNVYLIVTLIRFLVVTVLVLLFVGASVWADRRLRRRLRNRGAAAAPRATPAGNATDAAPACECQVGETSAVRSSPTVVERTLHRRAA